MLARTLALAVLTLALVACGSDNNDAGPDIPGQDAVDTITTDTGNDAASMIGHDAGMDAAVE